MLWRAKHKICRVAGYCLYDSAKCPSKKRPHRAGEHGGRGYGKLSDYGGQLFEKQKLRATYGMREKQLLRFFKESLRQKGVTGDNLLKFLESRLDNAVYRMGVANTIFDARQLVSHGHVLVNGRKVDIPSSLLKAGDTIELSEKAKKHKRVAEAMEESKGKETLPYIVVEEDNYSAKFVGIENVADIPNKIDIPKVVEFYSR